MNASKENARKARRFIDDLTRPDLPQHGRLERERFIVGFLDAAERKLPTEEAFERDKKRKKITVG